MERVERLNEWRDCKDVFSFFIFFIQSSCSLWRRTWVISFSMLFEHCPHSRSLSAPIYYFSFVSIMFQCEQNLWKLANQRVYQNLVYWNNAHRCSFAFSCRAFALFSYSHFFTLCPNKLNARKRLLKLWYLTQLITLVMENVQVYNWHLLFYEVSLNPERSKLSNLFPLPIKCRWTQGFDNLLHLCDCMIRHVCNVYPKLFFISEFSNLQ